VQGQKGFAAKPGTKVERHLAALRAAEVAELGEDVIVVWLQKGAEASAERDSTIPPDKVRSRLEQKISAKEASVAKSTEAVGHLKTQLEAATDELGKRVAELEKLQADLAAAPDDDEVSCECEDEGLDPEYRGNIELVRLHRMFEAAKASFRMGERPKMPTAPRANETPTREGASATAQAAEEIDMEVEGLNFEGDDFDEEDLNGIGDALGFGADVSGETSAAKRVKLADWFQTQTKKRLRGHTHCGAGKGVVRLSIAKVSKS
jgi:hypothetical protein